ncbi:MAG: RnfABCDGE type electron transport complex subunit B [Oscillospiraceae bacterium]|nr:RnfABCDGE type electron transport complex subunit B [Candidatus Equicaccousia limihippi]
MELILNAVLVLAALGLLFGALLAVVSKYLGVKEDEKEAAIRECLPGANCGACGFTGCDGYAAALAKGEAEPDLCVPGGADTAAKLGEALGVAVEVTAKKAVVLCRGNSENAKLKFDYRGLNSCAAAAVVQGGPKACAYGCLGLGDCQKACPFGAITVKDGIATVDKELCTGCGACAKVCPKGVIDVMPQNEKPTVLCHSLDRGPDAKKACAAACIGCGLCMKNCESGAIKVENFLAKIDKDLCTGCQKCTTVCPMKCIK